MSEYEEYLKQVKENTKSAEILVKLAAVVELIKYNKFEEHKGFVIPDQFIDSAINTVDKIYKKLKAKD